MGEDQARGDQWERAAAETGKTPGGGVRLPRQYTRDVVEIAEDEMVLSLLENTAEKRQQKDAKDSWSVG